MINIILELTFVNDMVDLLADTLNSTIYTQLPNDVFVVLALTKLEGLIDLLGAIGNDIFKLQWAKILPFLLDYSQSNTRRYIRIRLVSARWSILVSVLSGHYWLSSKSIFS